MKSRVHHFTLTEVILAMSVITVAVLPMLGLLTATSKVSMDNRKKTMIRMLAAREVENLVIQGWTQKYAATASSNAAIVASGNAKDTYTITQKLKIDSVGNVLGDDEFPQLSSIIENLKEDNFRHIPYTAFARLGIATNDKGSKLLNVQGDWQNYTVSSGSDLTGINLSPEQAMRYQNGGYFCVATSSTSDAIFSFSSVTGTTQLNNVEHFYDDTVSGNIIFLEKVLLVPINQRNKLYNFNGLAD